MKDDFTIYNKIYAEYFKNNQPCRTTVEITGLPTPIAIELKCIATIQLIISIKRAIYDCSRKNPQILAPLVLIWVSKYITATDNGYSAQYNEDQEVLKEKGVDTFPFLNYMTAMHVGLSSAYANTMAGNLGYKTGCCKCFTTQSTKELKHILGVNQRVELMLGIGEADETKKHNEDQETSFNYGTIIKEPIKVINL